MRIRRAFLAAAPVVLVGALASSPAAAQPVAVFPEPEVDLGEIVKGDVVSHDFEIRNEGDAELEIVSARPTCGCSVTDFPEVIEPGAVGRIRAQVDTRSLHGPVDTAIRVATSDPDRPEVKLTIRAQVKAFLGARPGHARWNTVETETEGTIGITLWPLDRQAFEISDVVVTSPDVQARVRPAAEAERFDGFDGPQWRVELTLGSAPPIGAIGGFAEIRTTHSRQERVHIPLSGFVRPLIFVEPDLEDLGTFSLAAGPRRARYQIRNFGTAPMTIEGVELDIEGVEARVEPLEEGYIYWVSLIFSGGKVAPGGFAGKVVVRTDLPARPEITWKVSGTVAVEAADVGDPLFSAAHQ